VLHWTAVVVDLESAGSYLLASLFRAPGSCFSCCTAPANIRVNMLSISTDGCANYLPIYIGSESPYPSNTFLYNFSETTTIHLQICLLNKSFRSCTPGSRSSGTGRCNTTKVSLWWLIRRINSKSDSTANFSLRKKSRYIFCLLCGRQQICIIFSVMQ